jgi:hypothetical protein
MLEPIVSWYCQGSRYEGLCPLKKCRSKLEQYQEGLFNSKLVLGDKEPPGNSFSIVDHILRILEIFQETVDFKALDLDPITQNCVHNPIKNSYFLKEPKPVIIDP